MITPTEEDETSGFWCTLHILTVSIIEIHLKYPSEASQTIDNQTAIGSRKQNARK